MLSIEVLRHRILLVSIYKNILQNPFLSALCELLFCGGDDYSKLNAYSNVFSAAAEAECTEGTADYINKLIFSDENSLSIALSFGREPSDFIYSAALQELDSLKILAGLDTEKLKKLINIQSEVALPTFSCGQSDILSSEPEEIMTKIMDFHKKFGYGIYTTNYAFFWDNGMVPIKNNDPVRLYDLKGYDEQRAMVIDNTESFLQGLRASNILLYGDRGTGKSSTVHALLNEYSGKGLRILELPKEKLSRLGSICESIALLPYKFIIFIDDLSFSENNDSFGSLKAVLEGSLAAKPDNVLIYATSNRRHLVRQSHSDRSDEVSRNDTMQEILALSDRFGITITFINPDKKHYLDIIDRLSEDRNLSADKEILFAAAERWALKKGGRSPRAARQFIDYAESKLIRGLELN